MFQIIVNEITGYDALNPVERYRQTVDTLDLMALMQVINRKPRSDKGKSRKKVEATPI